MGTSASSLDARAIMFTILARQLLKDCKSPYKPAVSMTTHQVILTVLLARVQIILLI